MGTAAKRQRRMSLQDLHGSLVQGKSVGTSVLQAAYTKLVSDQPLALLPSLQRKERAALKFQDASERARKESESRVRFAVLLGGFVREAQLPVVAEIAALASPEAGWKRYHWPQRAGDLVEYAEELYESGCGKTALDALQAALTVLESAGKVRDSELLSGDTLWVATLRSITSDLVAAHPPRKPAELPTVATVVALELSVCQETLPLYFRAMAWVFLLILWCSLRADDVQGLLPESMLLNGVGFSATLGKTKTTGPDRRVRDIKIFVARETSLTGCDWLSEGLAIWTTFSKPRDYLVLEAKGDWSGPTGRAVDPSALTLYLRHVLANLRGPLRRPNGQWVLNLQVRLYPNHLESYITAHALRDWLASLAAALGVPKPKPDRDFLGRWSIGSAGGSADYVRTSREVVQRVQDLVAKTLVTGKPRPYLEHQALDRLAEAMNLLDQNGAQVRAHHDILRKLPGAPRLGGEWPTFIPGAEEEELVSVHEPKVGSQSAAPTQPKYFITVSKHTGFRRLHLNGQCYVKPFKCRSVSYHDVVDGAQIDAICRDCKRRMRRETGEDPQEDSSSTSGTSSGTEAAEGEAAE
ncbi:unnamed protein product [Symbiodinium natans]|uniref:Uncharacterized protein n=1 Tax=Symbiodinium natans TaxID=878477 RepID=A0A812GMS9_9DINO|nr:unnamed protein product [Symbiodinium natans]